LGIKITSGNQAFGFQASNVIFPTGLKGETYHIGAIKDTLPKIWIVPGSYERADAVHERLDTLDAVGALWTDVQLKPLPLGTRPHQYHAITGKYNGSDIGICSTGIGAPAAEIDIIELLHGGARLFVRAGTSGCVDPQVMAGDLVVVNESRGNIGTVMEYLGRERMDGYIPSDRRIVTALEDACLSLGLERIVGAHERGKGFKTGRGYCADSFYHGQGREVFAPLTPEMQNLIPTLQAENVITIEMETPGIAAVIKMIQERGYDPKMREEVGFASILTPVANRVTDDWNESREFQMQALKAASEALSMLDKKLFPR
jgi:uridine phosphorylase